MVLGVNSSGVCDKFFTTYNHDHRHSGIGLHTPASVHFGIAEAIRAQRATTLAQAYAAHPERFNRRPTPPNIPAVAWINPFSLKFVVDARTCTAVSVCRTAKAMRALPVGGALLQPLLGCSRASATTRSTRRRSGRTTTWPESEVGKVDPSCWRIDSVVYGSILGHHMLVALPSRQIRGLYTTDTITVYQAYSPAIAQAAVAAGKLVAPFNRDRMTWIKPSFLWMMYRSGWASQAGQQQVLSVEIRRTGFEWALANSCLSHFDRDQYADRSSWSRRLTASPVRVQWDPERSLQMQRLSYRSLQVGLSGAAVDQYVDEWIVGIADVTATAHEIRGLVHAGELDAATNLLPPERPYPLPPEIAAVIGANG